MSRKHDIRFGLGWPNSVRSAPWRVRVGSDSSVYLLCDSTGSALKASYHPPDPVRPGRESRVAWTAEYVDANPLPDGQSRTVTAWASEEGRLEGTPLRQLGAVVLGRFSLGLHPSPDDPVEAAKVQRRLSKVAWVQEMPPPVQGAWQFTIIVGDPNVNIVGVPGERAVGALPVGHIRMPSGAELWVTRRLIDLGPDARATVERWATTAVHALGVTKERRVYRGQLMTQDPGLHSFVDIAVTLGLGNETPLPAEVEAAFRRADEGRTERM